MDNSTVGITMKQWGITCSSSKKPRLVTEGAGPCLVMTVYHKRWKIAALTHFDTMTAITSIQEIHKAFAKYHTSKEDLEVHLMGGWNVPCVSSKVEEVMSFFKQKNISVINRVFEKRLADPKTQYKIGYWSYISIDSCTGKVTTSNDLFPATKKIYPEFSFDSHSSSLKKVCDYTNERTATVHEAALKFISST